jgi:hypothetical protein
VLNPTFFLSYFKKELEELEELGQCAPFVSIEK